MMADRVRDHPKDTKLWGVKWATTEVKTVCSMSGSFSFLPPLSPDWKFEAIVEMSNISGPTMRPTPNGAFSRKNSRMKGSLKQMICIGCSYLHAFYARGQHIVKLLGSKLTSLGITLENMTSSLSTRMKHMLPSNVLEVKGGTSALRMAVSSCLHHWVITPGGVLDWSCLIMKRLKD